MAETVDQDNEIERARRLTQMRDRARVFREVFGTREKPTTHGKVILDALQKTFGRGLPKNMMDDTGRTDMWLTARCLGHFDVLEMIFDCIDYKESAHEHPSRTGTE